MLLTDWLKRLSHSRPNLCAPSRLPRRKGTRFVDAAEIAKQPETLEKRALLSATNLPLTDIAGDTGFVLNAPSSANTNFGLPNRAAGDVNGDGFEDFILGSIYENSMAGTAYVLFGKSTGFSPPPDLDNLNAADGFRILGHNQSEVGVSVFGGGDINGDGFDDLVVAAPNYTRAATNFDVNIFSSGYVIFGKADNTDVQLSDIDLGASDSVGFSLTGFKHPTDPALDRGFINTIYNTADSVATGGDINGDGFDDVVFGGKHTSFSGGAYIGAAFVVFGKESGFSNLTVNDLDGTSGFTFTDSARGYNSSSAYVGAAVSIGGDINGDGFDDLVVGAPGQNSLRNGTGGDDMDNKYDGEAYVVFGRSDFSATPIVQVNELDGTNGFAATGLIATDARTGTSVSSGGDINGDGIDDFVIGAPGYDNGYDLPDGRAYVVFGKTGANFGGTVTVGGDGIAEIDLEALSGATGFVLEAGAPNDLAGTSVSITGDINGDGFDDVVVGAPSVGESAPGAFDSDNGRVYVLFGASNIMVPVDLGALNGVNGFAIEGVSSSNAGRAISNAGDINGDGFDDLLITEPYNSSGTVFGFFGNQFDDNSSPPVAGQLGNGLQKTNGASAGTLTADAGSGAADILVGGGGNDTLNADGGSDVLIGGQGDDTLVAKLSNFSNVPRFDGGTGVDTLTGDASFSGATIDLTTIPGNRINDIEVIDLEDGATETLTLNLKTVLAITGAGTTIASSSPFAVNDAHTLTILRDADDTINIGSGWTQGANVTLVDGNIYEVFTQGGATVRIQSAIVLTGDVNDDSASNLINIIDAVLIFLFVNGADDPTLEARRGPSSSLSGAEIRSNIEAIRDSGQLNVNADTGPNNGVNIIDAVLIFLFVNGADDPTLEARRGPSSSLSGLEIRTHIKTLEPPPSAHPAPPSQTAPADEAIPELPSFLALPPAPLFITTQSSGKSPAVDDRSIGGNSNSDSNEFEADEAFGAAQIGVTMDLLS